MKKIILTGLCLTLSAFAFSRDYDGCYQLVNTGSLYPAVCLSGTMEEGIGGAGVRLAVFGTNTNKLIACLESTAVSLDSSRLEFIMDGRKELVLSNFSADGISGDAMVGNTRLKFVRLSETASRPLRDSAYRGNCQ